MIRLSGTGTDGATIRLYLEKLETDEKLLEEDSQMVLAGVRDAILELSRLSELTGRTEPDVIT